MTAQTVQTQECDVLVIGAGAGGLATAVTAAKHGLNVIVVEKASVFGGTMAFSGGVLWIPGNAHCPAASQDTREAARQFLQNELGAFFDAQTVDLFLDQAPKMVEWFERETSVRFIPTLYPDYHPTTPGGVDVGRAILAAPFDIRTLGKEIGRLRPPLKTITFIGMMFNSSNADLKHFFRVTKSLTSFLYVAKRLVLHVIELLRYRRGIHVTSGNALAARLAKSAFDLSIPIWTATPASALLRDENGAVCGAIVQREGSEMCVTAKRGVVLACGGFPHDAARIAQAYPHLRRGGQHVSPTPLENSGDGIRLAESMGGQCDLRYPSAAAWMPVSLVPYKNGQTGVFPHLLDRYKPGVIGVTQNGQRFCNEADSYHDVGAALIDACKDAPQTVMWLICDQTALSRYGLGFVKPAPMPSGAFLKNGYLLKGHTLAELADKAGIDAVALQKTVDEYNVGARRGEDTRFGRGTTSFNRYLADPEHQPNPCVAPVVKAPFYAVKVIMGDLGTFDGLRTNAVGQVLDASGAVIKGLYAVGNDRASMMGGNYPSAGITLGPNLTFGFIAGKHLAGTLDVPGITPA